jgi:Leucine-rich repeat (LRR) protein
MRQIASQWRSLNAGGGFAASASGFVCGPGELIYAPLAIGQVLLPWAFISLESVTLNDHTTSPHYQRLIKTVPTWLGNATAHRRQQLKRTTLALPAWYSLASNAEHHTLKTLNAAAWTAQNPVDQALSNVLGIHDFARPKLQKALREQFALELDVEKTLIRLYIPATIPWFPLRSGGARTWTVSLLEAALHNFETAETHADAHEHASSYLQQTATADQFELLTAVKARMGIQAFIQLCRSLDIGGQYQAYLAENFLQPVASATLQAQVNTAQDAMLKAALQMAVMKQDLDSTVRRLIEGIVDGLQGMRLDGKLWQAHDLSMMSAQLSGIVVFAPNLERYLDTVPVVAYIPDDPESPIKQYTSSAALMLDLTRKLRARAYQRFFSRFVAQEDRGYFFADLNQRLSRVTWHQHVITDPMPTWRETPVSKPNLQFALKTINGDVLPHLYQQKLNKIINDAAVTAVSTASADRKARWERWDALQNIATTLLEIVAFVAAPFFPPLGALMIGYTLYQVLDETFESIIDWAQGRTHQALGHFFTLLETLVQLGMFATGVPIAEDVLRKVLPQELWSFIDKLKPVTLPDGQSRLWHPDLKPYQQASTPFATTTPDAQGLHYHGKTASLQLPEGRLGIQSMSDAGVATLRHPRRTNAYQPRAWHNGAGAWRTELDTPLSWSDDQLLRRLGHTLEDVPLDTLKRLGSQGDIDYNALRKVHVNSEPLPPQLVDQIKRWRIDRDLQRFIDQMHSDDPAVHAKADPQTQLQLLTSYGLWPETKALRFLNTSGETSWQYVPKTRYPVVQIHEAQLARGDLLSIVLQTLNETEIRNLLGEPLIGQPEALPVRTARLRKKLAALADEKRASLFDSRYRGLEVTNDPRVQALVDSQPGLPSSIAQELLRGANQKELQQLSLGKVPDRLKTLARWAQQEVRLTRAYEGLFMDSSDTPDAALLALHSLEHLPGWSNDVRIEVKQLAFEGALHDSIGKLTAVIRKVLVMHPDGEYQAYDHTGSELSAPTDCYNAILQALPDAERSALGLNIGEGAKLRQNLRDNPLPRDTLRPILLQHPLVKPAYDPATMRLPGGMDGYAPTSGAAGRTLEDRTRELFPAVQPAQIEAIVAGLARYPGGAQSALITLQAEYQQLEHDLSLWEADTPRLYPGTEVRLSRQDYAIARQGRQQWAQQLKRCWRLESAVHQPEIGAQIGYKLQFKDPLPGTLPTLNLHMPHVTFLELKGDSSTEGIATFLQRFTNLHHLALRDIPLNELPKAIFEMPYLTQLVLSNCKLTLSATDHAALAGMSRLQVLDLFANPLGLVPTVEGLPELLFLDLAETGISTLPQGLLTAPKLDTAILRGNRIGELPEALFELPANTTQAFDFSGNPLSRATLNKVKTYYQRTGEDLSVQAPQPDIASVRSLYPTFETEEASRFIMGLPGDLDAGQKTLARLQQEYQTLQSDLDAWVVAQPTEHPILGVPLDVQEAATEQFKRGQLKQLLEQAWRRETDVNMLDTGPHITHELMFNLAILGELPTLRANFDHVSVIKLKCDNITTSVDAFLNSFPKLSELRVYKAKLGGIPKAVFRMQRLRILSLAHCDLRRSDAGARSLAGMDALVYLDLRNNPLLSIAPDVSQMPDLALLALSRCGLTELPNGLLTRTGLELVDLRNNRLTSIPPDFYEIPSSFSNRMFLSGNPFSAEGRWQIQRFSIKTGIDLTRRLADIDIPPGLPIELED